MKRYCVRVPAFLYYHIEAASKPDAEQFAREFLSVGPERLDEDSRADQWLIDYWYIHQPEKASAAELPWPPLDK